jgi:pre-mRNA-processing factor 39
LQKTDEETTALRERIISIRRKVHKVTVSAVADRWNFEEGVSGNKNTVLQP